MTQPSKIASHYEEALTLVPSQFVEKPIFEAFLKTWMDECQEIEDTFYNDLFTQHIYENVSGTVMDKLAAFYGLSRYVGETDDELKRRIVGEIMKRSSDGTPDRIREIISSLLPIKNIKLFEHYPSSLYLYGVVDSFNFKLNGSEADYLKDAAPVGTGSCVLGFVEGTNESKLFIPSEIDVELKNMVVYSPAAGGVITDPLFEQNLVTPDTGSGLNNIVVRDSEFGSTGTSNKGRGVLPEIGHAIQRFAVDNKNGSEDDFSVDRTEGRIEGFYVDIQGVDNSIGVMLEIVQRVIPFVNNEPVGIIP